MAVADSKTKGLSAEAPTGGISAQLGTQSFPLVLGNGEIERFEEHHDLGIYALLDAILQNRAKATHCRDIVALGLIGAGMADVKADSLVADLPPFTNLAIRSVARDLVFAAFADPKGKKKHDADGSAASLSPPPDTAQESIS